MLTILIIVPSINANVGKVSQDSELVELTKEVYGIKKVDENSGKRYLIFGSGDISGIYLANITWYLHGEYRGFYRGDLLLFNGPGMMALGYFLSIKDFESGQLFNKESLPEYLYIEDYVGYIRRNYYCPQPHGPVGWFFGLLGLADNFYKYIP